LVAEYLNPKYPAVYGADNFYINGRVLPSDELVSAIRSLKPEESLYNGEHLIALRSAKEFDINTLPQRITGLTIDAQWLYRPHDIFSKNADELSLDFELLTNRRESQKLSNSNIVVGDGNIFLEEGAKVEGAILNASSGPIYIGRNAEVMEGSIIRGALALCERATLKLGAKIYGATTVGPHSKVGGEVNNSVIIGYSNKGHDGFLGNSVLGEWCNIGADSNNSNLKNNYAEVKLWDYVDKRFTRTGLQFCGLIMGDHSKCGINTMFNTGTVVGVSSNIFGTGFPRNLVPSFAWGGNAGFSTYQFKKAMETARLVMERRGIELDEIEEGILQYVFNLTGDNRFWEPKKEQII